MDQQNQAAIQLRLYQRSIRYWWDPEEYQIWVSEVFPRRYVRILKLAKTGKKAWAVYGLWETPGMPERVFCNGYWCESMEAALDAAHDWLSGDPVLYRDSIVWDWTPGATT